MTATNVSRLFRSAELGRLAALAAAQGWSVDRLPGGHVQALNPRNGARVLMSGTGYTTRGTLKAKVHEFVQAGLDPDWTRKRERAAARAARTRQEAPMHVRDATAAELAPTTVPLEAPEGRPKSAGGKFAMLGPWEVVTLADRQVRVGHRADGAWVAGVRDASDTRDEFVRYAQDRDTALARAEARLASVAPDAPPFVQDRVPEALEAHAGVLGGDAKPHSFHVVQVGAAEFPMAAALDALDATVAPALAALEAAGKTEAADLVRGELTRSPLEAELLALYRRVLRGE